MTAFCDVQQFVSRCFFSRKIDEATRACSRKPLRIFVHAHVLERVTIASCPTYGFVFCPVRGSCCSLCCEGTRGSLDTHLHRGGCAPGIPFTQRCAAIRIVL
ncbi:unnamed protein product [Hapterophycus canaliculatus]